MVLYGHDTDLVRHLTYFRYEYDYFLISDDTL